MDIKRREALEHIRKNLGEYAEGFIDALSAPPKRAARVNTLKGDPDEISSALDLTRQTAYCKSAFLLEGGGIGGSHPYHHAGLIYIQEPSAMLAIEAAKPYLAEIVLKSEYPLFLDVCAAPGGKSGGLAEILGGKGVLVANETVTKRAAALSSNLMRLGARNAVITSASAESLAAALPDAFDAVAVDAPCSGEGMLRKEESSWDNMNDKVMYSCAERQSLILTSAAKCVKEGGILVYSTCTLNEVENENVLAPFIESGEFLPLACPHLKQARLSRRFPAYRALPQDGGGEGHFVCVMRKMRGREPKIRFRSPFDGAYKNTAKLEKILSPLCSSPLFYPPQRFRADIILCPPLPEMCGVYIVRAGVKAAAENGANIIPDHAYAAALTKSDALPSLNMRYVNGDGRERDFIDKYLCGQQLPYSGERLGFGIVAVDGYPLGLVKATSDGVKNHYPKALRN